jgi:hypothetical protein
MTDLKPLIDKIIAAHEKYLEIQRMKESIEESQLPHSNCLSSFYEPRGGNCHTVARHFDINDVVQELKDKY